MKTHIVVVVVLLLLSSIILSGCSTEPLCTTEHSKYKVFVGDEVFTDCQAFFPACSSSGCSFVCPDLIDGATIHSNEYYITSCEVE